MPVLIAALLLIVRKLETTQMSISWGVDEQNEEDLCNEVLVSNSGE